MSANWSAPSADHPEGAEALRQRRALRAFILESVIMLCCYLGLMYAMLKLLPTTSPMWLGYVRAVITGGLPGTAMFILILRMRRRNGVTSMARTAICAACLHALTGMPIEHDGCVVCPECGAAWRVERAQT